MDSATRRGASILAADLETEVNGLDCRPGQSMAMAQNEWAGNVVYDCRFLVERTPGLFEANAKQWHAIHYAQRAAGSRLNGPLAAQAWARAVLGV